MRPALLTQTRRTLTAVSALTVALLTGCGIGTPAGPVGSNIQTVTGKIHGGQLPIQGATVKLYHTNPAATTYGAAGVFIGSAVSDVNGNFVIASSSYSGTGSSVTTANCPAGSQAYITAAGGYQTGTTQVNTSMLQMAALGDCSGLSTNSSAIINELTTVAAAYALSGFMTTSVDGTNTFYTANISAPAANSATTATTAGTTLAGLAHAFINANNLVPAIYGQANSTITASSNGTTITGSVPYVELLTLADIMQSCVDSQSSPASPSTGCSSLFALTPSISGVAPKNTLQAFINLARNPYTSAAVNATTGLLSLASGFTAYQPQLSAPPIDWSLSIVYGHATLPLGYYFSADANDTVYFGLATTSATTPALYGISTYGTSVPTFASQSALASTPVSRGIAADGLGNIWLANNASAVDRFSTSTGALLSTFATGGSSTPIAVDKQNNLWVGHVASGSGSLIIDEAAYTAPVAPSTTPTWVLNWFANAPAANFGSYGLAVDANQNIWSASYYNSGTTSAVLSNIGTAAAPSYGTAVTTAITPIYTTVGTKPYSTVFDASGNGWVAITGSNTAATTGVQEVIPNATLGPTSLAAQTAIVGTTAGANGNVLGTLATQQMAIDGAGTIFIPDNNASTQGIHMYSTQTANTLSPSTGIKSCYLATSATTTCGATTGAAVYNPRQPVIDSTGSVWAGETGGGVVQIIGVAAPTYPLLSVGKPGLSPGLTAVNPLP